MISIKNKFKTGSFILATAVMALSACNKGVIDIPGSTPVVPSGLTLGATLAATPNDSLFYRMVVRGGMLSTISSTTNSFTVFVADNNAMRQFVNVASGGLIPVAAPDAVHSAFISGSLPATTAGSIVGYNICPQALPSASIPTSFPNLQYPSILNPAPSVSAFLRLTTFPSRTAAGAWLNNYPISSADAATANGVIHHTAALVTPPSIYLWNKIDTDPNMVLLRAAILRADADPTAPGALQSALLNIGANLTVFAPDTTAFKGLLSALSGGALPTSAPNATFAGFIGTLPITTVKGIVVYHILGKRAFSVNLPTTSTQVPTLLNGAVPSHPGLGVQATFVNVPGFGLVTSSATVKGAANAVASTITGKDNHYLNGVLHVINQVLLPQ